jgi:rod shape-determining protein MreD
MMMLRTLGPSLAILLSVLVCALPWGLPSDLRLVPPMLPYVVIHLCVERRREATPDWLVFLAGFATDVAGQGPLGYWALIYLSGYTMACSAGAERDSGPLARLLLLAVTVTCLALMQWAVASVYEFRAADLRPAVIAAAVATAAYLLLVLALPSPRAAPQRLNSRLERGL